MRRCDRAGTSILLLVLLLVPILLISGISAYLEVSSKRGQLEILYRRQQLAEVAAGALEEISLSLERTLPPVTREMARNRDAYLANLPARVELSHIPRAYGALGVSISPVAVSHSTILLELEGDPQAPTAVRAFATVQLEFTVSIIRAGYAGFASYRVVRYLAPEVGPGGVPRARVGRNNIVLQVRHV